jgi:hypothetical protein
MITTLRNRKENAYNVAPPAPPALEDRLVHLQASPQAVAWDLYGNRLLYHRADWHYRIIAGSSPEEIVDYGRVDCVICALPAAAGPLTNVAQGQIVALVASDQVTGNPGYSGPRIVELIAADPVQGQFAVYAHREDVESPYVTILSGFEPGGGLMSAASLPQPLDDTPRWHVPHAVLHDDILYAIERDSTAWPEAGPATGRIVRRAIGSLGGLVHTLDLPEGERFVFPHTLAYNADQDVLYVFATRLVHQDWTTHQTSTMSTLRAGTLELLGEQPVDFGFFEYDLGSKRPYYLGIWESAGGPNTGGLCVFDGTDAGFAPRFVSSAINPATFDPLPWAPRTYRTFRWWASARGTFIESVGASLPIPLHRSGTGFIGAWQGDLPEEI